MCRTGTATEQPGETGVLQAITVDPSSPAGYPPTQIKLRDLQVNVYVRCNGCEKEPNQDTQSWCIKNKLQDEEKKEREETSN